MNPSYPSYLAKFVSSISHPLEDFPLIRKQEALFNTLPLHMGVLSVVGTQDYGSFHSPVPLDFRSSSLSLSIMLGQPHQWLWAQLNEHSLEYQPQENNN